MNSIRKITGYAFIAIGIFMVAMSLLGVFNGLAQIAQYTTEAERTGGSIGLMLGVILTLLPAVLFLLIGRWTLPK